MRLRQIFLWTMIAAFVASAAIGVFAILMPGSRSTEQLLITALLVGAFSLLGMMCAFVMDKRRLVRPLFWLMCFGIACSVASLIGWLSLVWWEQWFDADQWVKFSAISTFLACWTAHLGMLAILPVGQRDAGRIVRVLTIICTTLLTLTLSGIVITQEGGDAIFRFIGVLSILGACGTIVTPIMALLEWIKTRGTVETMPGNLRISVQCPRCGSDEQLTPGVSACSACGLRIEINVQEPRCDSCGYLLYRLESDTCPECGNAIAEKDRWVAARHNESCAKEPSETDSTD